MIGFLTIYYLNKMMDIIQSNCSSKLFDFRESDSQDFVSISSTIKASLVILSSYPEGIKIAEPFVNLEIV